MAAAAPPRFAVVRYGGGAYLVYLGVRRLLDGEETGGDLVGGSSRRYPVRTAPGSLTADGSRRRQRSISFTDFVTVPRLPPTGVKER
jgi:hypothetical protein